MFKTRESIYLHRFILFNTKDLFLIFFTQVFSKKLMLLKRIVYFNSIECIHQHQPSWTAPFLTMSKVFCTDSMKIIMYICMRKVSLFCVFYFMIWLERDLNIFCNISNYYESSLHTFNESHFILRLLGSHQIAKK